MKCETIYTLEDGDILYNLADAIIRRSSEPSALEELHTPEPLPTLSDGRTILGVAVVSVPDELSDPADSECYSAEDVERYGDTWAYCGMIAFALVSLPGDPQRFTLECGASLWGIERGLGSFEDVSNYIAHVSEELVSETIAELQS